MLLNDMTLKSHFYGHRMCAFQELTELLFSSINFPTILITQLLQNNCHFIWVLNFMHLVLILLWLVNFPFQPFAHLMSHSPSSTNCYIFWCAVLFKLDSIIIQSLSWVYRVHYRCFILICISDAAWWQHKVKKKKS